MNHDDELWQEFRDNGEVVAGKGHNKNNFDKTMTCGHAHVWLWRTVNGEKELLLQKRAADKRTWPGYWDISAAGHINFGETAVDAAKRETYEEIGIEIDTEKLYFVFADRLVNDESDNIRHVFLYEFIGNDELNFLDGEVEEVKWAKKVDIRNMIDGIGSEKIVPHRNDEYFAPLFGHLGRL